MAWGINEGMQRWSCRWYVFNAPKIYQVMSKSPPKCCLSSRLGRGTLAKRGNGNASNFSGGIKVDMYKQINKQLKHIHMVYMYIYIYMPTHPKSYKLSISLSWTQSIHMNPTQTKVFQVKFCGNALSCDESSLFLGCIKAPHWLTKWI